MLQKSSIESHVLSRYVLFYVWIGDERDWIGEI